MKNCTKDLDHRITILEEQNPTADVVPQSEMEITAEASIISAMSHQTQKWVTHFSINVFGKTHTNIYANLDSCSDLNCIRPGYVPGQYWQRFGARIHAVDGNQVETNWFSWGSRSRRGLHFLVQGIHELKIRLSKVRFSHKKGLEMEILLGNPFLTMIQIITISKEGIRGYMNGKHILFRFVVPTRSSRIQQAMVHA